MENQMNVGNQNTQQIGQNPVSQPVMTSEKPKTNYLMIGGIVLACFLVFGFGGYFLGKQSTSSPIANGSIQPSPTTISTPANTIAPSPTNNTSNQQLKTHDSKFVTFQYPASLYEWSFGRGVNLEYFQINSVDSNSQDSPNRASIDFDIHVPQYRPEQTLEEKRQAIIKSQQEYPSMNYVMTDRKIDGYDALVIESTGNTVPSSSIYYSKNVWVRKNNVMYEIGLNIVGESVAKRDSIKAQYNPVFENILNSVKLKYVDPTEVEQLGNHPD